MRRPWERDRSLAHVPVGWRQAAASVLAVAAEHCIPVGVGVRWSAVPHPFCPALAVVEPPSVLVTLPAHRVRVQEDGRLVLYRIAARAVGLCMSCGARSAPAHVQLQANGAPYIALLCDECEDGAALDGADFWAVIGRYDPLILERDDDADEAWHEPEEELDQPEQPEEDDDQWPLGGGDGR